MKKISQHLCVTSIVNKLSVEVKASLVFVFASICSQGMAVISMPLFTRLLTTEQMGVVTTYNTWLNLISLVTTLGLTSGAFNMAMMHFESEREAYTSASFTLSLIPSIAFNVLILTFSKDFSTILNLSIPLIRCLGIMLILTPALNIWLMEMRYEYKYIAVFVATVFNSAVGTAVSVASVLLGAKMGVANLAEIRVISSAVVTGIISIIIIVLIYKRGHIVHSFEYWKYALKNGLPLIVHSIAKYILDASDRILIGMYLGTSAVGIYGVVYNLSSISLVFWSAINAALIPFMFERIKLGEIESIRSVSTPLLMTYAVVCVFIMLLGPEIVTIMAGESYLEAVTLIPPIATGIYFTSLYNLYSNLLLYKERGFLVMCATISSAILNIVLNMLLLPVWGYVASAYATLASCCLLALMQYLFSKAIHMSNVLDNRFNLLLSIVVITAGLVVNLLYGAPTAARIIFALVLSFLLILNRNKIISAVRTSRNKNMHSRTGTQ